MAGPSVVQVVDSGPGYTTVLASDGNTYTIKGEAAWRNNNPGNLRPGSLTNSLGAIGVSNTGSNGKFLVFPDRQTGLKAQEALQFETPAYSTKTIAQAVKKYAPKGDNNNPEAYAARLANALGVSVDTRMGDLTPSQRAAYLQAQHGVEGGRAGTIRGPEGVPVPAAFKSLFGNGGVPLPPASINPLDAGIQLASYGAGRVPLPAPAPLIPPKALASMPSSAMYGQGRLVPGQKATLPTDFTTADTGAPDLRTLGMTGQAPNIMAGLGVGGGALPNAPVPMPGRPPALNAVPAPPQATVQPVPQQSRPPVPRAPVAPPVASLRLASGKTIAPGIYDQGDHSVQVSADPSRPGYALVSQIHGPGSIPGVIDPLKEMNSDTVAGGMIRNMLPGALAGNASAFMPTVGNNIKSAALGAANNLGSAAQNFGGGILGGLGGLFGQHQALPHPFNLLGGALQQQAPQPMNRPSVFSMPQQQAPQHQTRQQANNDLRESGMIDQFGMIRM